MTGRNDNECGQMGVKAMAGTDGWIIVPPHDKEYAVEPVAVGVCQHRSEKQKLIEEILHLCTQ